MLKIKKTTKLSPEPLKARSKSNKPSMLSEHAETRAAVVLRLGQAVSQRDAEVMKEGGIGGRRGGRGVTGR